MLFTDLIEAAGRARTRAYAPYSKFAVGAALLTKSGKIFIGCNVENVSLGLTICAERAAVAAAIANGDKEFVAMAIVADFHERYFHVAPAGKSLRNFITISRLLRRQLGAAPKPRYFRNRCRILAGKYWD